MTGDRYTRRRDCPADCSTERRLPTVARSRGLRFLQVQGRGAQVYLAACCMPCSFPCTACQAVIMLTTTETGACCAAMEASLTSAIVGQLADVASIFAVAGFVDGVVVVWKLILRRTRVPTQRRSATGGAGVATTVVDALVAVIEDAFATAARAVLS